MSGSRYPVVGDHERRYRPEIEEFLSQCEINYWLILHLVPWLDRRKLARSGFALAAQGDFIGGQKDHRIMLQVLEQAPYTTTLKIRIRSPSVTPHYAVLLTARLYHDAQLLEVMEGRSPRAIRAKHSVPNNEMKSVDEKRQLNRFLGETLKYGIRFAQPVDSA